jgi:type VI secretion system protein ImpC
VPVSGLLDQMLAEEEAKQPATVEEANDLGAFVRRVSAGHTVPREDPARQQQESRRHERASELLRGILRQPRLQAIESAWRGLYLLTQGLETDGNLQLHIMDISLPELIQEMDGVRAALLKNGPWALIVGNYTFGQTDGHIHALQRLAGTAKSLGAPFLAEAWLSESGAEGKAWSDLRNSEGARWLGLAMPRFLLRLPYGKATSAIESFPFEEMPRSEHSAYLWGNPAFACAYLIGSSFAAHGWDLGRRLARRIDDLPLHVYRENGDSVAKPCAEILMTEREAENLLDLGFMPLVSIKNEPAAVLVRFQSIAEPPSALAGL